MFRICSPENDMTSDIRPEMTAATAMPASRRVTTWTAGPTLDSRYTRKATASAPAKAAPATPNPPRTPAPPATMTAIAPNAAPEDTPMTAGSAIGFRNRPWNSVPATASPTPTTAASSTRGSRSWNRITSTPRDTSGRPERCSFQAMRRSAVPGGMPTAPRPTPRRNAPTSARTSTTMTARYRRASRVPIARPYPPTASGCRASARARSPAVTLGPARLTRSELTRATRWSRTAESAS